MAVAVAIAKLRSMQDATPCAICNRPIPCGSGYIVKIDVYADPQMPPMTTAQVEDADLSATLADLNEQIQSMSADDLQDGVHRSFTYRLCVQCQKAYLANPLGMPRRVPLHHN